MSGKHKQLLSGDRVCLHGTVCHGLHAATAPLPTTSRCSPSGATSCSSALDLSLSLWPAPRLTVASTWSRSRRRRQLWLERLHPHSHSRAFTSVAPSADAAQGVGGEWGHVPPRNPWRQPQWYDCQCHISSHLCTAACAFAAHLCDFSSHFHASIVFCERACQLPNTVET